MGCLWVSSSFRVPYRYLPGTLGVQIYYQDTNKVPPRYPERRRNIEERQGKIEITAL